MAGLEKVQALIYANKLREKLAEHYDDIYDIDSSIRGPGTYSPKGSFLFKCKDAFDYIRDRTATKEVYQHFLILIAEAEGSLSTSNDFWKGLFSELKIYGQLKQICEI